MIINANQHTTTPNAATATSVSPLDQLGSSNTTFSNDKNKLIFSCGTVSVGDIFSADYGYESTRVSFYQVIALKGKKTVVVRKINSKLAAYDTAMSCYVKPVMNEFAKHSPAIVLRVSDRYHSVPTINIDKCITAYLTEEDEEHYCSSY